MKRSEVDFDLIEQVYANHLEDNGYTGSDLNVRLNTYMLNTREFITLQKSELVDDFLNDISDNFDLSKLLLEFWDNDITFAESERINNTYDFKKHVECNFINFNELDKDNKKYCLYISIYLFRSIWDYCVNYFGIDNMLSFKDGNDGEAIIMKEILNKLLDRTSYNHLLNENKIMQFKQLFNIMKLEILKYIKQNYGLRG